MQSLLNHGWLERLRPHGFSEVNKKPVDRKEYSLVESPIFLPGPEPPRKGNYVLRHWRGELPLGVSCWVNAFLLSFLFHSIISPCIGLMDVTEYPRCFSITVLAAWAFYYTLVPWQYTGLWRSAARHMHRTGRRFSARAAQVLVLLGVAASLQTFFLSALPQMKEYLAMALQIDRCSRYTLRVLPGGVELEVSGAIGFGLTDSVSKTLDENPGIRVVRLNSDGGRVGEARKLHELIAEKQLITSSSRGCFSACTDAFLGGVLRVLHRDARLGFHRPFFPGLSADEAEASVRAEKDFLLSAGVSAGFVEKALSIPPREMWLPTTYELLQAHVLTPVRAVIPSGSVQPPARETPGI